MTKGRLFIGVCLVLAVALIAWRGTRARSEEDREAPVKSPAQISHTPEGEALLKLDPAAQARAGLEMRALVAQMLAPEIVAYGRLEEDPSRSFVLRAPVAGILHFAPGKGWPARGDKLGDGAVVGSIEPRLGPVERISLTSQLVATRSELNASTAAVTAARAAYERARVLNADNKNVSDRVVQEAEAHLRGQEERLKAATETVRLLESSLESGGPAGSKPLVVERGGDVVEAMAQPGEAIEPGSPILRVANLDRLLARVDVPVGQRVSPAVATVRIIAAGFEDRPIRGARVSLAPVTDAQTQGQSFLFRLAGTAFGLRPGLAVTAYLNAGGATKRGVIVPRSALVRVAGKSYAYVESAPGELVRKEVALDEPVEGGYFTSTNFKPGDRVVVAGAQTLLSEEFKSQTAAEESR